MLKFEVKVEEMSPAENWNLVQGQVAVELI
jgi:hypothetical protein